VLDTQIAGFARGDVRSAHENLNEAVKKGHTTAAYAYGLILLSSQAEEKKEKGLQVLASISRVDANIHRCREKVRGVLSHAWINYRINGKMVETACTNEDHKIRFQRGARRNNYGLEEGEDLHLTACNTCFWFRELIVFATFMHLYI
jgi:hypothetical protein